MDCEVDAGERVKLTAAVWPTETLTGCDCPGPNPAAPTSMR